MNKIRLVILAAMLVSFSGCIVVPVDHDHREHEEHDHGDHRDYR